MSGTLSTVGRFAFQLAFQASPIILQDGIASLIPGNYLPIIALTETLSIVNGLFTGSLPTSLDDLFCQFVPLPGASLVNNQIGMYPFANRQIAANAIIQQPLNVSLLMIAPVKDTGGYVSKIATFTALQWALQQHNNTGGTYTIATPAYVYTDCVMTGMRDATAGDGKQAQVTWQLDFIQPLISQSAAAAAFNGLMGQIANGLPPSTAAAGPAAGTATGILGTNVSSYVSAATVPVLSEPL